MGWLLVFATTPPWVIAFAPAALALRLVAYFGWARITRNGRWGVDGRGALGGDTDFTDFHGEEVEPLLQPLSRWVRRSSEVRTNLWRGAFQ